MLNKENRTRSRRFAVRLSDDEQNLLVKKQNVSGLGKTEFFVSMLKNSEIKVFYFEKSINNIYYELRKIGVNLNQIAHHANSGEFYRATQEFYNMLDIYKNVFSSLQNFLERPLINATVINIENFGDYKCLSET